MASAYLHFTVSGERRACPVEWWDAMIGPKPPDDWECDGCTASPDYWMGYALWPACRCHDWGYDSESPDWPRFLYDIVFRVNLWRLLRLQRCPMHRTLYVTLFYWGAVVAAGHPHFKREP